MSVRPFAYTVCLHVAHVIHIVSTGSGGALMWCATYISFGTIHCGDPDTGGKVGVSRCVGARRSAMATCEGCGNDDYLSLEVITAGVTQVFDTFECAVHKLALVCHHCGCKVPGHGIKANGHVLLLCALCSARRRNHCCRSTRTTGIDIAAICTQPDGSPPQADERRRGTRQPSQYGWNGGVVNTSREEKHHD